MSLTDELRVLYEIRSKKIRQEKILSQQAMEVKNDIRNLTVMFSDGIDDIAVEMDNGEYLEWDSRAKRLVYNKEKHQQFIEVVGHEVLVRIQPYLKELVKKAQEHYL